MANTQDITQIPAPRVDFIDRRTGLMAREWYRFFVNIYNLAGQGNSTISLDDLQVGPSGGASSASVAEMMKMIEVLQTQPPVTPTYGSIVSVGGALIRSGFGSPNSAVVGNIGDLFMNKTGGAGVTLYVKESGAGTNTGWVGK
jgi:hypothetical protein